MLCVFLKCHFKISSSVASIKSRLVAVFWNLNESSLPDFFRDSVKRRHWWGVSGIYSKHTCSCNAIASSDNALGVLNDCVVYKSMHSLTLRYCLTQVVVEKRPLNGCRVVVVVLYCLLVVLEKWPLSWCSSAWLSSVARISCIECILLPSA